MIRLNAYKTQSFLSKLFLKKTDVFELETTWSELSSTQFSDFSAVLFNYLGKVDIVELRLRLLQALTGYERSKKRFLTDDVEQINGNLFILSQFIRFPFQAIFENPEIIQTLSDRLRNELKKSFLFEIHDPELKAEISKYGGLLKYKIDLRLNITRNMLPVININGVNYYGPTFSIDEFGVLKTDLCAGEWIQANEYMQLVNEATNHKYLPYVAACLYRTKREDFSETKSLIVSNLFEHASPNDLTAVWIMFKAIQKSICSHLKYSVLFKEEQPEEKDDEKIKPESADILYQLSKDGFGSLDNLLNMPILDFLNIQLKNIREAINSLRSLKKNNKEISEALKMDIETLLKF